MNELEKRKLQDSRPDIDPGQVEELASRFSAFQQSSRFPMFQSVCIAQFFSEPDAVPDNLKSRTVEELCQSGAFQLSLEMEVTPEHIRELIIILDQLLPSDDDMPKPKAVKQAPQSLPRINSVEAERLLREAFEALRVSSQLEYLGSQKIEKYWNASDIRAPFIEAMTFRELIDLKIDHLLKKRSFSDRKIYGLLETIKVALAETHATSHHPVSSQIGEESAPTYVPPKWQGLDASASSVLHAMVKSVEEERIASFTSTSFMASVLRDLTDRMSQRAFITLWFAGEGKLASCVELLGESLDEVNDCWSKAAKLCREILQLNYRGEVEWFDSLLSGVGVPEVVFTQAHKERLLSPFIHTGIMRMIIIALGGGAPQVLGESLGGYWTSRPDGLYTLLSHIALTDSSEKRDELFGVVIPQFPESKLQELIRKIKECH